MEALMIIVAALWFAGYPIYRSGKREGSRKGYHVGRSRARRSRR